MWNVLINGQIVCSNMEHLSNIEDYSVSSVKNWFFLSECNCNAKGTEDGTKCEHDSIGKCRCQESAKGHQCGECNDGYYGFGTHSFTACKGTINLSVLKCRFVFHKIGCLSS